MFRSQFIGVTPLDTCYADDGELFEKVQAIIYYKNRNNEEWIK